VADSQNTDNQPSPCVIEVYITEAKKTTQHDRRRYFSVFTIVGQHPFSRQLSGAPVTRGLEPFGTQTPPNALKTPPSGGGHAGQVERNSRG